MLSMFDEYQMDYVPAVHCAKHGTQPLFNDECQECYDEWMKELDKAWVRGCPLGYGENSDE